MKKVLLLVISIFALTGCSTIYEKAAKELQISNVEDKYMPYSELQDYNKKLFILTVESKTKMPKANKLDANVIINLEDGSQIKAEANYYPFKFSGLKSFKIGVLFDGESFSDEFLKKLDTYKSIDVTFEMDREASWKNYPYITEKIKKDDIFLKEDDYGSYILVKQNNYGENSFLEVNNNYTYLMKQKVHFSTTYLSFYIEEIDEAYIFPYAIPTIIEE